MEIIRGSTYRDTLRWATAQCQMRDITAITQTAPVVITAVGHGIPDGWPVAITSVQGMREINATTNPPRPTDYRRARVIDADTFSLPCVDATSLRAYTSGGVAWYRTPVDLDGYSARMQIRDRVGGELLLELTSAGGDITLDNVAKTIVREISAAVTEAIEWRRGVYDLEMFTAGGYVIKIDSGQVRVRDEVTV